jgi:glycosyltransferase involved in cell wall biosynthesis
MNGIWISWENHRRNKGISKALGFELYEIVCNRCPKMYRYFISIFKTIKIILNAKPNVVIVQNPSKVLVYLVLLFRKIGNYKVIVDAHNRGIFPREGKSKLFMYMSRYFQKCADLTIVTNDNLKSIVEKNHGKAFVLPDRIPEVPDVSLTRLEGKINIVFICTFDVDEPYLEVISAVTDISECVYIYITGKYEGKINDNILKKNINLLGYIPENKYWSFLLSSDIIIDLTLREDCLVCGAYEGIAVKKPLILSDTKATRSYFRKGCVYVKPNAVSIRSGIMLAIERMNQLTEEIDELKFQLSIDWDKKLLNLKDYIESKLLIECRQ